MTPLPEDAVVARGTGGGDGVVGPHEAQVHGQQRPRHVGNREWYAEGVHAAEPLRALPTGYLCMSERTHL